MASRYFGKSAAEMAEIVAAEAVEAGKRSQRRWDAGIEQAVRFADDEREERAA